MEPNLRAKPEEIKIAFTTLSTKPSVATLLEVPYSVLIYHLYRNKLYHSYTIPKKNGKERKIDVPVGGLKILQSKLSHILQCIYNPPPPVQAYTFRRSVITNAKKHVRKNFVLNLDLSNFFPSINFGRVNGLFRAPPYSLPAEAALVLAQIATYNGALPQGAPSSPIISNMICRSLDRRLVSLSREHNAIYTRYCDDISISSNKIEFPKELAYHEYMDDKRVTIVGDRLRDID